jgi:hypothetical protein
VEIVVFQQFASAQEGKAEHESQVAVAGNAIPEDSTSENQEKVSSLLITGDFNHDGIADIAKITSLRDNRSEFGRLTVLLGQTNGTFLEKTSMPVPGRTPRAMIASDFNRDGFLDLIVGDEDGTLVWFPGDGTGSFGSAVEITHLDSVMSIAVADFNKDGIPDIAVADWRASSVTVLLGVGNGSFGHMWSFPLRMRGTTPHIAAADFNGDGIPDLAIVYDDEEADSFDVWLGNGNGTFTIAPDRGFSRNPNSHCNT